MPSAEATEPADSNKKTRFVNTSDSFDKEAAAQCLRFRQERRLTADGQRIARGERRHRCQRQ